MEYIRRKVRYEDLGRTNLIVTATTLNFPFMLKQSFEDVGIYTDVENPIYETVDLSGLWDTSNNGIGQKPCLTLNNCLATITSTPISYFGGSDGTLNAVISPGCPGPYTYSWTGPNGFSSNSLTLTGLKTGNYTLKITDGNCDFSYLSYYLQQPQALYVDLQSQGSTTNVTIGCNGTASVTPSGGQPPYTYTWYSFTPPAYTATTVIAGPSTTITGLTNLCAGVYSVQVTDSTPVTVSNVFTITQPSAVSGSVVTTGNVDCNGGATGTIILSAAGGIAPTGYTYILTGPIGVTNTTGSFYNLPACPTPSPCYNATIYDGGGNFTTVGPISITQPIVLTISSSKTNVTCYGSNNGSILFTPGGGNSPYTVDVEKNNTFFTTINATGPYNLTGLGVGTYTTTMVDDRGCVGPTTSNVVQQRPDLNITAITLPNNNGYTIPCFGGTISQTVSVVYVSNSTTISPWLPSIGLTYPMEFYVDNVLVSTVNALTSSVTLTAGTHTIKVVDYAGCSVETDVTITQPPQLAIVSGIDYIEGLSGCTGCGPSTCRQGIINVTGGVGPYTITWTMTPTVGSPVAWGTGITSDRYCASEASYTSLNVQVTDANGCLTSDSILV